MLPADWQAQEGRIGPGDLSRFAPEGFGLGTLPAMRPWDTLDDAVRAGGYYGLDDRGGDPIRSAPSTLPQGGTVYFDRFDPDSGLDGVLRVLAMDGIQTDYVVFTGESPDTVKDRYLDQMRIVGFGALAQLFAIPRPVIEALPRQKLGVGDAVRAFLAQQASKWHDADYRYSRRLAGSLGGDGDWAKERLGFGLTVENGYWDVFRVWSRPWLVTK